MTTAIIHVQSPFSRICFYVEDDGDPNHVGGQIITNCDRLDYEGHRSAFPAIIEFALAGTDWSVIDDMHQEADHLYDIRCERDGVIISYYNRDDGICKEHMRPADFKRWIYTEGSSSIDMLEAQCQRLSKTATSLAQATAEFP